MYRIVDEHGKLVTWKPFEKSFDAVVFIRGLLSRVDSRYRPGQVPSATELERKERDEERARILKYKIEEIAE
jgi:hypothetical protein